MKTTCCARWKSGQDGGRSWLSSPCAPASHYKHQMSPSSPVPGGRHPHAVSARENGSLFKKMASNQGAVKLPRCVEGRCTWTSPGKASISPPLQTHRFLVSPAIVPPPSCFWLLAPISSHCSLKFPKAPGFHFHQQKQPLPSWNFHLKWLFHYPLLRRLKTEFWISWWKGKGARILWGPSKVSAVLPTLQHWPSRDIYRNVNSFKRGVSKQRKQVQFDPVFLGINLVPQTSGRGYSSPYRTLTSWVYNSKRLETI